MAVMGFTITPPLPFKSRDTLPKIDTQRDMLRSVNSDGYPSPDAAAEADCAWDPRELTDQEKDKATQGLRWDNVVDAWLSDGHQQKTGRVKPGEEKGVNLSRSERAVLAWATRLGFEEGVLTGRKPLGLIARFDDMIPAAPAIAVGSAICT